MPRQQWRNGIANLVELAGFSTTKLKPVGKRLQSGRLVNQQTSAATIRQADAVHITRRTGQDFGKSACGQEVQDEDREAACKMKRARIWQRIHPCSA